MIYDELRPLLNKDANEDDEVKNEISLAGFYLIILCGMCQYILTNYGYYEDAYQLGSELSDKMEKNAAFLQDIFLDEEAIQEMYDYFQDYDSNKGDTSHFEEFIHSTDQAFHIDG